MTRDDTPVVDPRANTGQCPHMVVRIGDTVFTSVMVFLRKNAA